MQDQARLLWFAIGISLLAFAFVLFGLVTRLPPGPVPGPLKPACKCAACKCCNACPGAERVP
jgi:hypothetical protein